MKNPLLYLILLVSLSWLACGKDDNPVSYDYHSHIMQPSSASKHMGDVIFIQVEFESHTGEAVEHINIRLYNKDNLSVVYNQPQNAHIAGGAADYEFQDQFILSEANGVSPGDWVLEATVWGADEGQDLVIETIEFSILP